MRGPALVFGLGVTGQAVARTLAGRGVEVVLADDMPSPAASDLARELGVPLHAAPSLHGLRALVTSSEIVVPSPGVPEGHPVIQEALALGVPVRSEFDLATAWEDRRPFVAITGTDGKTTVTTMVTAMLEASGISAVACGNTEVPLVTALDLPVDVFVVEASSFRLRFAEAFHPRVGTWLNFADDHLDWHPSIEAYAAAKAHIWAVLGPDDVAIANADDAVVAGHLAEVRARRVTFGTADRGEADWHLAGSTLVGPGGAIVTTVERLTRSLPHDIANALAAAATAVEAGASLDAVRSTLETFRGLPHRVTLVADVGGVAWYDDSKATAPHATLAAVRGFPSVVLIAGGRNKGLDLSELAAAAPHVRAVVAIGEAAADVVEAFRGLRPVLVAGSMAEAVAEAARLARPGDAVLLSPGCASFDWYRSYAERGDDFSRAVRVLTGVGA
ncbi:MAG: UDP-N-acetylmuramoyl-L-alanine--D-glutamate ligase [Acidimicrobiales bacterium]|nr:UDP-N-acetylmuramoyl-L-alanine--D-glutamate ligase [Acidimicrobiales bacterium]